MKLIIDRAKWLRGEGSVASRLLRKDDGKMCCLGFLGLACGKPPEDLLDRCNPAGTPSLGWPAWLMVGYEQTQACWGLMQWNDSESVPSEEREQQIAAEFAKHGVEVEFV